MDHIKIIDTACPFCGTAVNSAMNADETDVLPKPFDPNVCIKCAGLSMFGEDMKLHKPSDETIVKWRRDSDTWRVIWNAIRLVNKIHGQ